MVSRLRPIDISITFEDRAYQLGETIRVDVEVTPHMDVTVREAHMEIVCLARYTEIGQRQQYLGLARGDTGLPVSERFGSDLTSASLESESAFTYPGPTFVKELRLSTGSPNRHRLTLDVPAELPENVSGFGPRSRAKTDWSIVVSVNVAGARDVSESVPVNISQFAQDDSVTPEQRRDQAREAAQHRWESARRGQPTEDEPRPD